jgi:hypothetical protein
MRDLPVPRWLTYVLIVLIVLALGVALAAPIGPMPVDRYKDNYPEIIATFPPVEEFSQGGALFELVSR